MADADMKYEKVEEVVFIYLYVIDKELPVYRFVHMNYKAAHEDGQRLVKSGVTEFCFDGDNRQIFHPPHKIDRYECFPAKRFTERLEKANVPGAPEEMWYGHYEDMHGVLIDY